MRRRTKHPVSRRLRSLPGRVALLAALALPAAGCQDLFLTEPAPPEPVVLDLGPLLRAAPEGAPIEDVIVGVTSLRARVVAVATDEVLLDERRDVDVESPQVRFDIPLDEESVAARGQFVLLVENQPVFYAVETFTLTRGEVSTVAPVPDPEVNEVVVAPVPTVEALGTVVTLEAEARYATGHVIDDATFSYALSRGGVLEPVGGAGTNRFRAVGEGTVTVTVTASAGTLEFDQTNDSESVVVEVAPTVASLEADPTSLELTVDETAGVVVVARDGNGNILDREIDFSSTDPGVAEVTSTGPGTAEVTGVASGTADVEASFGDASVSIPVTVVAAEPVVLEATPSMLEIPLDQTAGVTVRALDANGGEVPITTSVEWSTQNGLVATVTPTGLASATVTAVGAGQTTVTARYRGLSVVVPVNVPPPLGTGDVQVTLTWNTTADLDLWVTDPFGERIWFLNPESESGGVLDFDDTDGFGPENIFWPEGGAPAGTYVVEVNHFNGVVPTDFQVRVVWPGGDQTYTGTTVMDEQTIQVVTFTVEEGVGGLRTVTFDDLEVGATYQSFERSGVILSGIEPGVLTVQPDPAGDGNAMGSCIENCPYPIRLDFTRPARALRMTIVGDNGQTVQTASITTVSGEFEAEIVPDGDFDTPETWDLTQFTGIESIILRWTDVAGMGVASLTFFSDAPITAPALVPGVKERLRTEAARDLTPLLGTGGR